MAAERFTRISSASNEMSNRWATEIAWAYSRKFVGCRVNIAISAELRPDPDDACDFTNLDEIFDNLTQNGLKCQLGIGGESPPQNEDWEVLTGTWTYAKRPPVGDTGTEMAEKTAETKSLAIDRMVRWYTRRGLNPKEYCSVELGNEPGRGGAGAPKESDGYWPTLPTLPKGTWDSPTNDPGATGSYSTFCEYFNVEMPLIDTQCLHIIAPTFASLWVDEVTNGLHQELLTCLANGDDWLAKFRSECDRSWGLNCYYDLGMLDISLGAELYAFLVINGRNQTPYEPINPSTPVDPNAIRSRLAKINAWTSFRGEEISICEAGICPLQLGMENPADQAEYNRKRRINYFELGRARLACIDGLCELPVKRVDLYTASDTPDSDELGDQYGAFTGDFTVKNRTYSAEIPFGMRAGATNLAIPFGTGLADSPAAAYVMAANEVLPPRLP